MQLVIGDSQIEKRRDAVRLFSKGFFQFGNSLLQAAKTDVANSQAPTSLSVFRSALNSAE
jgi:hypothetical protein